MKYVFLLLICSLTSLLKAQINYGQIEYVRSSEIILDMGEDDEEDPATAARNKQIRDMIAKMSESGALNKTFLATFSPTEFNFVQQVKPPAEMRTETGAGTVVVMTGGEDPSHFYTNTGTGEINNKDFILDKGFLVSGKVSPLEWTITGEKVAPSDLTAGLDLKIATAVTPTGDTITAGFAPSVPVNIGPMNYYGLPGAIITLEIPKGKSKTVFRATKINLSPEPIPVTRPEDGDLKKISPEKFRAERKKREKNQYILHQQSNE